MDYPEKVEHALNKVRNESGGIELGDMLEAGFLYPENGDCWGNWRFDAEPLLLIYVNDQGQEFYEIPLSEMTSSAQVLDWIFQLNAKSWASRKDMGDLVQALDDLIEPQGTLCSGGTDGKLNARDYIAGRLRSTEKP